MKDIIAFWGYPHPSLIKKTKEEYKNAIWLDLDVDFNHPQASILPVNYCSIIKNIFNNAIFYKERIIKILAPVGRDKCDSAIFAVEILSDMGFNIETSTFEEKTYKKNNLYISESNLPLKKKVELITDNIISEKDYSNLEKSIPVAGFWGVPPNDLSILELFPNETHIFGWMRCVEQMAPFDIELEKFVNPNIKTVFFRSNILCQKPIGKISCR